MAPGAPGDCLGGGWRRRRSYITAHVVSRRAGRWGVPWGGLFHADTKALAPRLGDGVEGAAGVVLGEAVFHAHDRAAGSACVARDGREFLLASGHGAAGHARTGDLGAGGHVASQRLVRVVPRLHSDGLGEGRGGRLRVDGRVASRRCTTRQAVSAHLPALAAHQRCDVPVGVGPGAVVVAVLAASKERWGSHKLAARTKRRSQRAVGSVHIAAMLTDAPRRRSACSRRTGMARNRCTCTRSSACPPCP